MKRALRHPALRTGLLGLAIGLVAVQSGCADSGNAAEAPVTAAATLLDSTSEQGAHERIVIDVRTPQEYAAGHLPGALLLDLNSGQFAAEISQLDPAAEYLIYCRSGNRSGQAVAMLQEAGFTQVVNLGSLAEAAQAMDMEIVTN